MAVIKKLRIPQRGRKEAAGRNVDTDNKSRESNRVLKPEITLTEEHQDGSNPLHRTHDVPKQNDRAEDREELPRCGDDGAGQRPKVHHCHEDEGLEKRFKTHIYAVI